VPESQAVNIRNRSYILGALVDIPAPGAQGVLFAHGSRFGGHALYIKDSRLHYVYNFVGSAERKIVASKDVPTGEKANPVGQLREGRRRRTGRRDRDPGPLPRRGEGRRGSHQDPARQVLARRRRTLRRSRHKRTSHRRLPGPPPAGVRRRHDQPRRGRRQRRALHRPRARGRVDEPLAAR
jgi:hypothetical protein